MDILAFTASLPLIGAIGYRISDSKKTKILFWGGLAFFFYPLALGLLLFPPRTEKFRSYRECPRCSFERHGNELRCRHCGARLKLSD